MKPDFSNQIATEMNQLMKNDSYVNKLGLPKKIASKETCCKCDCCADECPCKKACKNNCSGCNKISSESFNILFDTIIKISSILDELGCKKSEKYVLSALDMMISEAAIKKYAGNESDKLEDEELQQLIEKMDRELQTKKDAPSEEDETEKEIDVTDLEENEEEIDDKKLLTDINKILRKHDRPRRSYYGTSYDEDEDDEDDEDEDENEYEEEEFTTRSPESEPQGFFGRNWESHGLRSNYDDINDISDKLERELKELEKYMPELREHAEGIRTESPPGEDIIPDFENNNGWHNPTIFPEMELRQTMPAKKDFTSPPLSHADFESIHLPRHKILTEEDFLKEEPEQEYNPENDYESESEVPGIKQRSKKRDFKYAPDEDEIKVAFSNLDKWLKNAKNKTENEDEDDDEDFEDE